MMTMTQTLGEVMHYEIPLSSTQNIERIEVFAQEVDERHYVLRTIQYNPNNTPKIMDIFGIAQTAREAAQKLIEKFEELQELYLQNDTLEELTQ